MSLTFTYHLSLKRSETKKIELPNLKSNALFLNQLKVTSDHKTFDLQLKGKETIVSYGEAVFYQTDTFDLSTQMGQIVEAETLVMTIKNLCTSKDASNVNLTLTLTYQKSEGNIIYNQIYINTNAEGLANILDDIRKAGKQVTKVVWTSPQKLSSLELKPQFDSDPVWLEPYTFLANKHNQIVMDLSEDEFDPDFINRLRYYTLHFPDNLEKIGIIVYGYVN